MDCNDPIQLPSEWRSRATRLRAWGASEGIARAYETVAAELEQAFRRWDRATLTLTEAARESGYNADYLGQLVRDGTIPNAGRKGAPRIRRSDLPIKSSADASPEPRTSDRLNVNVESIAKGLQ